MTKILVTGGQGMLGKEIVKKLGQNASYQVFSVGRSVPVNQHFSVDLTDHLALQQFLLHLQPNIIIHCAALVDVNKCEAEKSYADLLHTGSTDVIVTALPSTPIVYISTDAVFDGFSGNYNENDLTKPLNYYAKSKLGGEAVIKDKQPRHWILRTNIVGFSEPSRNSFFEWGYKNLHASNPISGFDNMFFNPLYTADLAAIIEKILLSLIPYGTYHLGSKGFISKFGFLEKMTQHFQFDPNLLSVKQYVSDGQSAARPLNTTLNVSKIESHGITMPSMENTMIHLFNDFAQTQFYTDGIQNR